MVDLADRLSAAMKFKGISTSALSVATGISYQGIRKILIGQTKTIQTPTASALAKACGVNAHWLATDEGQMELADTALSAAAVSSSSASATLTAEATTAYLQGFETLNIPVLANSGSMGGGDDDLHEEVVVGRITVMPEWAEKRLKPTKLENLRFIHGYGDSMEPTFTDGDILLVDLGVTDPKVDGVYVIEANDRIYIKRVRQRLNGTFEVSSDNPTVKTVDALDGTSDNVHVRGRVVWTWNGRKL